MARKIWLIVAIAAMAMMGAAQEAKPAKEPCERCKDSKRITCETCSGDYKKATWREKCVQKDGSGCNGIGYRKCLKCRGEGEVKCSVCGGDGTVSKKTQSRNSSGHTIWVNTDVGCNACIGKQGSKRGYMDCDQCRPLWECTKCGRHWDSAVQLCSDCHGDKLTSTYKTSIRQMVGHIQCPKCKGTGQVERKGKCPDCREGKQKCPACQP